MNINLHIAELILDGLPLTSGQGPAVQAALIDELARLLRQRGMGNVSSGAVPHLSVGSIQVSLGSHPAKWGRQIARVLGDALAPPRAASRTIQPVGAMTQPPMPSPNTFEKRNA